MIISLLCQSFRGGTMSSPLSTHCDIHTYIYNDACQTISLPLKTTELWVIELSLKPHTCTNQRRPENSASSTSSR